ncbi:glutaredoxin domain-containing protein [Desulfopila aestuarii]|uniref:glutaredoxin domain-containing protein n=1 Tax=Desulfopila aestuarii TaxID=231440 RepID=UPI00093733D2
MPSTDIVLFSLSTSGHCLNIKKMLDALRVDYTLLQVDEMDHDDRKEALRDLRKDNPQVFISHCPGC